MIVTPRRLIVDENGNATQEFLLWINKVTDLQIIVGTGSPEGVVEAEVGRQYMNDAGTAGSILYIKRDGEIGGDTSQGWILV